MVNITRDALVGIGSRIVMKDGREGEALTPWLYGDNEKPHKDEMRVRFDDGTVDLIFRFEVKEIK